MLLTSLDPHPQAMHLLFQSEKSDTVNSTDNRRPGPKVPVDLSRGTVSGDGVGAAGDQPPIPMPSIPQRGQVPLVNLVQGSSVATRASFPVLDPTGLDGCSLS